MGAGAPAEHHRPEDKPPRGVETRPGTLQQAGQAGLGRCKDAKLLEVENCIKEREGKNIDDALRVTYEYAPSSVCFSAKISAYATFACIFLSPFSFNIDRCSPARIYVDWSIPLEYYPYGACSLCDMTNILNFNTVERYHLHLKKDL